MGVGAGVCEDGVELTMGATVVEEVVAVTSWWGWGLANSTGVGNWCEEGWGWGVRGAPCPVWGVGVGPRLAMATADCNATGLRGGGGC